MVKIGDRVKIKESWPGSGCKKGDAGSVAYTWIGYKGRYMFNVLWDDDRLKRRYPADNNSGWTQSEFLAYFEMAEAVPW